MPTFAPAKQKCQGHSPVGLERCSHIAEVPGSSPGVPTENEIPLHIEAGFLFVSALAPSLQSRLFSSLPAPVPLYFEPVTLKL